MDSYSLDHPLALYAWHLFAAYLLAALATLAVTRRRARRAGSTVPSAGQMWPLLLMFLPACLVISLVLGPVAHGLRGSALEMPVSVGAALAGAAALALLWSSREENCYTFFFGLPLAFVAAWFGIGAVGALL